MFLCLDQRSFYLGSCRTARPASWSLWYPTFNVGILAVSGYLQMALDGDYHTITTTIC